MKILGVDSSSSPASASVVCDGKILSEVYVNNGLTHSKTLMSVIDRALVFAGITADDIDSVAVAAGPGSFTGVRIGVSCAKGIAFERDIPCAAISTLEMLAYNLLSVEGTVCAVMDARCSQVYTATFKSHNGSITRITEDRAISIAELDGHLKNIDGKVYLVGDGAAMFFGKATAENLILASEALRYQKSSSAVYAAVNIGTDIFKPSDGLVPYYLRLPQAERELKKKQKGE